MKLRIDRTKIAMSGNVYSYDVAVPLEGMNTIGERHFNYRILRDGEVLIPLADATRPDALDAMPAGLERYDAFMAHNRRCEELKAQYAKQVYPELAGVDSIVGLIQIDGPIMTHDTRYLDVAQ